MKLHFFIFSLFNIAIIGAMEPTPQLINDVEEFIQATTDIENIDADLVSDLVSKIRIKWTVLESPEMYPKNYSDVEEFIQATTDIENIDADLVSDLIGKIRVKWTSIKSPELCPKYYLKDINLEK